MVIESRKCGGKFLNGHIYKQKVFQKMMRVPFSIIFCFLDVWNKPVIAVCNTSPTLVAAFELLVSLCTGCIENLQYVANALTELYYSGIDKNPILLSHTMFCLRT